MDTLPQPYSSPEYMRRHAEVLYWSYRRTLSYTLLVTMLGVVVFAVGLLALGSSVAFALVLLGVLMGVVGFVAYLFVEGLAAHALGMWHQATAAAGPNGTKPATEFCAYCGEGIPRGSPFCRYCGTKLR